MFLHHQPFAGPNLVTLAQQCPLQSERRYGCDIHAYCIMPDHVHIVVTPVVEGCSSLTFVGRFTGVTNLRLGKLGWAKKVWQPGHTTI